VPHSVHKEVLAVLAGNDRMSSECDWHVLDTKRCDKCINVDGMVAMGDDVVGIQPSIRGPIKETKRRIYRVLDMTHVNDR